MKSVISPTCTTPSPRPSRYQVIIWILWPVSGEMAYCANTPSVDIPAVDDEVLDNLAPFNVCIPDSKDLKSRLVSQWRIGSSLKNPSLTEISTELGAIRVNEPGCLTRGYNTQHKQ